MVLQIKLVVVVVSFYVPHNLSKTVLSWGLFYLVASSRGAFLLAERHLSINLSYYVVQSFPITLGKANSSELSEGLKSRR